MPTSVSFSKICQRYEYPFIIFKDYSLRKFSLGSRALLYKSRPSCKKDNNDGGGGGSHDNYDDDDDDGDVGDVVGGSHDNYDDDDGVGGDGDNCDSSDGPGTNIMVMNMALKVILPLSNLLSNMDHSSKQDKILLRGGCFEANYLI